MPGSASIDLVNSGEDSLHRARGNLSKQNEHAYALGVSQTRSLRRLTFLSQNICGSSSGQVDKAADIMSHNHRANADLWLLQEAKRTERNKKPVLVGSNEECQFYWYGRDDGCQECHGVGLLLAPRAQLAHKNGGEPEPIYGARISTDGARMMGLELKFQERFERKHLFVISAYMPTTSSAKDHTTGKVKEPSAALYNDCLIELGKLIKKAPKGADILIGGDFNARLGTREAYAEDPCISQYIGPFGITNETILASSLPTSYGNTSYTVPHLSSRRKYMTHGNATTPRNAPTKLTLCSAPTST